MTDLHNAREAVLLPCPLCGNRNPSEFMPGYEPWHGVRCSCGLVVQALTEAEAIAAWNRRPAAPVASSALSEADAPLVGRMLDRIEVLAGYLNDAFCDQSWSDVQRIADKLRSLRRLAPASGLGWLPIEGAPRDGTLILQGRPADDEDGYIGIATAGRWQDGVEDGVDYMGQDAGFVDCDYSAFGPGRSFGAPAYQHKGTQPTHWQPLPAAPIAAPASKEGEGRG